MSTPMPEEEMRAVLTGEHPGLGGIRRRMRRIPSNPRCKLCSAPFSGLGGAVLRHLGYGRFPGNPALCAKCIVEFERYGLKGTEIPVTLLFADVRGSTGIAERLRPAEFRAYLQRFYDIALEAILEEDGLVDKLVGDEVIGLFFGGVSGPNHAARAIAAGRRLLDGAAAPGATSRGPIPVGAAIHTGEAYVGTVGTTGAATDFTALGDAVNTTSRLVARARAGELLVSLTAAVAARADIEALERTTVDVRGREERIEVVSMVSPGPLEPEASVPVG